MYKCSYLQLLHTFGLKYLYVCIFTLSVHMWAYQHMHPLELMPEIEYLQVLHSRLGRQVHVSSTHKKHLHTYVLLYTYIYAYTYANMSNMWINWVFRAKKNAKFHSTVTLQYMHTHTHILKYSYIAVCVCLCVHISISKHSKSSKKIKLKSNLLCNYCMLTHSHGDYNTCMQGNQA